MYTIIIYSINNNSCPIIVLGATLLQLGGNNYLIARTIPTPTNEFYDVSHPITKNKDGNN